MSIGWWRPSEVFSFLVRLCSLCGFSVPLLAEFFCPGFSARTPCLCLFCFLSMHASVATRRVVSTVHVSFRGWLCLASVFDCAYWVGLTSHPCPPSPTPRVLCEDLSTYIPLRRGIRLCRCPRAGSSTPIVFTFVRNNPRSPEPGNKHTIT